MKATLLGYVFDRTPNELNFALNFASDGGDYWFFRRIYALEDGRKFALYRTSANLDYCEVSGSFADTRRWPLTIDGEKIVADGRELWVQVSRQIFGTHKYITPRMLSEEEFAGLTIETD